MIQPGQWLECLEVRELGRMVKVLDVFKPGDDRTPGLQKATAVVYSRGKITHFELDRVMDPSRFRVKN